MNAKLGHLRSALRECLLHRMIRTVGTPADKWKVLVVDRAALRILAAAIDVNQLVDEGVTVIEILDMRREPLPRIPAIYFVTPSAESIQQLANESPTQYKAFHLFFTGRLPDFQMDVLRGNATLLRKMKSFVELHVDFLALESRLFSLDRPAASLPHLYGENRKEATDEMATISERLTELCRTVAPDIPWAVRADASSNMSRTVASLVKEQFESARLENSGAADQKRHDRKGDESEIDNDRPTKGTVLIIDRVSDLASPLTHEFTYQAMAHDLLTLDYRKPGGAHVDVEDDNDPEKKKSMQLDDEEKDPVWDDIRSLSINEALTRAQNAFKVFLETDAAFKIRGKSGGVDIKDMGAAVRALPESQIRSDKHAMHIKSAKNCLAICAKMSWTDLALVEQDLITGRARDGKRVRADYMVESLLEILSDDSIPPSHRARLVMIAVIVSEGLRGLGGEHSALSLSTTFRQKLLRSKFESVVEMDSTLSAAVMGAQKLAQEAAKGSEQFAGRQVPRTEADDTVTGKLKQKYTNKLAQKQTEKVNAARSRRHGLEDEAGEHYDVARYVPPLRSIMMDLVDDALDKEAFPVTGAVSVDSIIASMGAASLRGESSAATDAHESKHSKFSANTIRNRSAAVTGIVKSLARGHSSEIANDDDGRFRIAERDHLFIIFVVGGVCYSEVRAMHEVCTKREANILIGGSQVLTPHTYIEALASVADPVVRIRVMLPPLPIELAQTRARARAARAPTKNPTNTAAAVESSDISEKGQRQNRKGATRDEEETRTDVEVVVGYKKSRGLFGRKKW